MGNDFGTIVKFFLSIDSSKSTRRGFVKDDESPPMGQWTR
jgi:hypothetical protein